MNDVKTYYSVLVGVLSNTLPCVQFFCYYYLKTPTRTAYIYIFKIYIRVIDRSMEMMIEKRIEAANSKISNLDLREKEERNGFFNLLKLYTCNRYEIEMIEKNN